MLLIKTDTRELTINDDHSEEYFDLACRAMMCGLLKPPFVMQDEPEEPTHKEDLEITQATYPGELPRELRYPKTDPIFERKSDERDTYRNSDDQELGIKGFMHIKCSRCGGTHTFYAKERVEKYYCTKCDKGTDLHPDTMRRAYTRCKCGNEAYYWTNSVEGEFDIPCINCGAPVSVAWNSKKKCYETMRG